MFCCVYMFICLIIQLTLFAHFRGSSRQQGLSSALSASFSPEPAFLRLGPTPFMCLLMTKHPLSLWTLPPISCQPGGYKRACHTVTCSLTWSCSVTARGPWAASLHSLGNLWSAQVVANLFSEFAPASMRVLRSFSHCQAVFCSQL